MKTYIIKYGKFGCYFHNTLINKDLNLKEVNKLLNKLDTFETLKIIKENTKIIEYKCPFNIKGMCIKGIANICPYSKKYCCLSKDLYYLALIKEK